MMSKHISWAHECEIRAQIEATEPVEGVKDRFKFKINPSAVKEIIFGIKAEDDTKNRVREIIRINPELKVTFYQAKPNYEKFKIDICKIE